MLATVAMLKVWRTIISCTTLEQLKSAKVMMDLFLVRFEHKLFYIYLNDVYETSKNKIEHNNNLNT